MWKRGAAKESRLIKVGFCASINKGNLGKEVNYAKLRVL